MFILGYLFIGSMVSFAVILNAHIKEPDGSAKYGVVAHIFCFIVFAVFWPAVIVLRYI